MTPDDFKLMLCQLLNNGDLTIVTNTNEADETVTTAIYIRLGDEQKTFEFDGYIHKY